MGSIVFFIGIRQDTNLFEQRHNCRFRQSQPLLVFLFWIFLDPAQAQIADNQCPTQSDTAKSWPGLTHQHDTSYATASAFASIKKTHPDAQLVPTQLPPGVALRPNLMIRLKAAGVYTKVYTFAGAPYSFCLFEPWFSPTVTRIQAFLARTLGQP